MKAGVLSIVLLATLAAGVGAATPRKWYWSKPRAEAMVVARVKIPVCDIWSDARCSDPSFRRDVTTPVISADCQGASEYKASFTYNRFTCHIITFGSNAQGDIAVYVIGRSTFHWRIIG
jgi:hypothetical protein